MKKSLISMICFTLLVSFFCSTSQVHAVNFEGQEDKYMKLVLVKVYLIVIIILVNNLIHT